MSYQPNRTQLAEKIKRSELYYLPSGDTIFLVENSLYRVHRYFFERESHYFRQKFSAPAPPGQQPKGSSDSNPFPLEEILSSDFDQFLWVFYNPKFNIYEANADQWISVLKLSCEWGFHEVKNLALRHLETKHIAPMEKIFLYHRYRVDKALLVSSYVAMAMRADPLTLDEGRYLGLETALSIARAREFARGSVAPTRPGAKDTKEARREGARIALDEPKMEDLIREIFFAAPSPSASPAPLNSLGLAHLEHAPGPAPGSPAPGSGHARTASGLGSRTTVVTQHPAASGLFTPSVSQGPVSPAPLPATQPNNLSHIWSSATPTVVQSGAATPAVTQIGAGKAGDEKVKPELIAKVESLANASTPKAKPDSVPGTPFSDAKPYLDAEAQKEPEGEDVDSWFNLGGKKKKSGARGAGAGTGTGAKGQQKQTV